MISSIKLYVNTLKYLKLSQLYWQIRYKLYRSQANISITHVIIKEVDKSNAIWLGKKAYIDQDIIELINLRQRYQVPNLWNHQSCDDLWRYNIHYFDYINNPEVDRDLKYQLVTNWIVHVNCRSVGWQAYPTSLRIVNWIKWIIKNQVDEQKILHSLYSQCCHLDKNIEYHILANHLFANIKAMLIAGLFFDSVKSIRWVKKYTAILLREIKVQILENGGHYELSHMYHNIILEDILDIYSFCKVFSYPVPECFSKIIINMLSWSEAMTHPDGGVSFFNDSVNGIASSIKNLKEFAIKLGVNPISKTTAAIDCDGYYVVKKNLWDLKFDAADVIANHQPGHTHADSLSFELSVGFQRFFVNSGISSYHNISKRRHERSTCAHNTLVVDGKNSSEVWSKFRLARRAKIIKRSLESDANCIKLFASHNGYKSVNKTLRRSRKIEMSENLIKIFDIIEGGNNHLVELYFYFHPDVEVSQTDQGLFACCMNQILKLSFSSDCTIEDAVYSTSFNRSQSNKVIIVREQIQKNYSHTLVIENLHNENSILN